MGYEVANKISQDPIFLKKYSDVADQSADDLVQDIIAPQEAAFNYEYYTGASKGDSPYDATHWIGPEGYLCPSTVEYAKIKRAVNVEGYWRVVLQNVPKSMFTTECSPWTLVILTVDFSSIPTSFPLLVLAIFLNKLLSLFPTHSQSYLPFHSLLFPQNPLLT